MPLPPLHNKTLRMLIMASTVIVALSALGGTWAISYWEARQTIVRSMAAKTDMWATEIRRLADAARSDLASLDKSTQGETSQKTAAAMKKFVLENHIYRAVWLVKDGNQVCSDTGVPAAPIPMAVEMCQVGAIGDVKIIPSGMGTDKASAIINYNSGKGRIMGLLIPSQTIGELMRHEDSTAGHAVFFMNPSGVVMSRSVNAAAIAPQAIKLPPTGISETENSLVYSRDLPGDNKVVAIFPKKAFLPYWQKSLLLYGAFALVLLACFFVIAWVSHSRTLSLESELREASRSGQIISYYQPILDLKTGRCAGFEMLMRWRHPVRGLVPPLTFIPEAERTGVITEMTERMMDAALDVLVPVFKKFPHLHAAINIPVQTLTNPNFPKNVASLIKGRCGYENISFELTESTTLTFASLDHLHAMKNLGIRLAVDDFGTGYSIVL